MRIGSGQCSDTVYTHRGKDHPLLSTHSLLYPQESFSGKLSAVHGTGVFNTPTHGNGDGDTAGETDDKGGDTETGDKVGDNLTLLQQQQHVTLHEVEWVEGEFMVK